MSWKQRVVSILLDIMKYVLKCPAKDTAQVSRKGKLRFAKGPFPDARILITAHMYKNTYVYMFAYRCTHDVYIDTQVDRVSSVCVYVHVHVHMHMYIYVHM